MARGIGGRHMILQLNPPIPINTPMGSALAHFMIDYGPESHLMWVSFLDSNGECWTWPNDKIRAQVNVTMNRFDSSKTFRKG